MQPLREKIADQDQQHDTDVQVEVSRLKGSPEQQGRKCPYGEVGNPNTWPKEVGVTHAPVTAEGRIRTPDKSQRAPIAPGIIEPEIKVRGNEERAKHETGRQAGSGDGIARQVEWQADQAGGCAVDGGVLVAVHRAYLGWSEGGGPSLCVGRRQKPCPSPEAGQYGAA